MVLPGVLPLFVLVMTRTTSATGTSPGSWLCSWSSTSLLQEAVHPPQDTDHCTEHAGALQLGGELYMGRDHRRQAMEHCAETSL